MTTAPGMQGPRRCVGTMSFLLRAADKAIPIAVIAATQPSFTRSWGHTILKACPCSGQKQESRDWRSTEVEMLPSERISQSHIVRSHDSKVLSLTFLV